MWTVPPDLREPLPGPRSLECPQRETGLTKHSWGVFWGSPLPQACHLWSGCFSLWGLNSEGLGPARMEAPPLHLPSRLATSPLLASGCYPQLQVSHPPLWSKGLMRSCPLTQSGLSQKPIFPAAQGHPALGQAPTEGAGCSQLL